MLTECVSWRWNGNLGDDLIWAAQEDMFGHVLTLGQWLDSPQALLIGGGTFIPKIPMNPDLARLSRAVPSAVFSTGVDDPRFWGTQAIPMWKDVLASAEYIGVRGPASVEWLVDLGFPEDRLEWVGDAALWFADRTTVRSAFRGRLAVNVGTTFGRLYGNDEAGLIEMVVAALRRLSDSGWEITLVCAWQPDDEVLDQVSAGVPVLAVKHWHDDWGRALDEVDEYDLVLAEKLHVAVVAACRGVPFVALGYRSKVTDFCRSLAWDEYMLRTDLLTSEEIVGRLEGLAEDVPGYSVRLQGSVRRVRKRLEGGVRRVVRVLGGGP